MFYKEIVGIDMKILYGTTNKGKLQTMEAAVKSLDIELIGLNEIDCELPRYCANRYVYNEILINVDCT